MQVQYSLLLLHNTDIHLKLPEVDRNERGKNTLHISNKDRFDSFPQLFTASQNHRTLRTGRDLSMNAAELPWCYPDEDVSKAVSKYKAKHGIIFATVRSSKTVLAVQQPSIITKHGSMKYSRSTGGQEKEIDGYLKHHLVDLPIAQSTAI